MPHSLDQCSESPNYGEILGHKSAITSVRWLNQDKVITSSADTTLGLWDTNTGKRLRKFSQHSLVVNEVDHDSSRIASAGDDGFAYIWDENSKKPVNSFKTEYPLLTIALHKNIIYTSGIEPVIRAWDLRSPSQPIFEVETQHSDTITSLSVDDSNLISRSMDDTVRIYEPKIVPGNHIRPNAVYDGATSGNENLLIRAILREHVIYSGSADRTITSWDLTSKKLLRKLTGNSGTVIDVDEHEGKLLSTSVDGTVILRYTNA